MAKDQSKNRYIQKEQLKIREKKTMALANKHINLGLIVYFLIFAYLIFCVLSFSFSEKTNYTMAEPGIIVDAESFKGLLIKDEVVIATRISGNTNFFIPEGDKVKQGSLVSCVDNSGILTAAINKEIQNKSVIDKATLTNNSPYLQAEIKNYVVTKNEYSFENTYVQRDKIKKVVFDLSNTIVLEDPETLAALIATVSAQDQSFSADSNLYYAPKSGVVSYNFDGFESLSIDNFTIDYLGQEVNSQNPFNETSILKGGHLFKIVNNYKWYIAAQIDDVCQKHLEGEDWVSIYVPSKDMEIKGRINSITNKDSDTYLIIEFDRYLNDFLQDRFVDFTINYYNSEGIKIPNSAITTKDFLKVPVEAIEELNHQVVVKKKVIDEKAVGGESLQSVGLDMYKIEEGTAYVPVSKDLNLGDTLQYILKDGTNMTFTMIETVQVEGVFVINKGYAAFKIIETQSFNEDYKIIKDATQFGVKRYDRIATDSSSLNENQIIK